MQSHSDVIALWPTVAAFALDVNAPKPTVRVWKRNGSIPPNRFDQVIGAAERRGFEGVTYRFLTEALRVSG